MGKNMGMLFDFPSSRRLSFWMHNTYLPLEIAFIDEGGKITEIKEMIPMSTRPVVSSSDCKYALEVNRGWFDNNNVSAGCSVGGVGINLGQKTHKVAQMTPQIPQEQPLVYQDPNTPIPPLQDNQQEYQQPSSPDVLLNRSHKEILEDAQLKGQDLIIMYVKKDGYSLPPKSISPPFLFETSEDGEIDAVVKAWDNQDASWKSFLLDNIIDIQVKDPN